ncbi:MAG: thioredoxin domain-containing protein [Phycisphaerae bacterium]|jgi:protein-disulfide isomerase/uncharacterized membrane protein
MSSNPESQRGERSSPGIVSAEKPSLLAAALRWLAVALCAGGWWLSMNLLQVSGGAAPGAGLMQVLCADSPQPDSPFDCQSVLRSRRAYLRNSDAPAEGAAGEAIGLPWAAMGAGYFAMIGCWYLFVARTTRTRFVWQAVVVLVVGFGVVVSVELIEVMAVELRRWCAGCLAVHGANALLFLISFALLPWRKPAAGTPPFPSMSHALAAVCAGLCVALLHMTFARTAILNSGYSAMRKHYDSIVQDPEFARWSYARQERRGIPSRDGEYSIGNADAPIVAVAFVDYECSACRSLHETISAVLEEYPGKLRVTFRNYPLDRACNPHTSGSPHPGACRAAAAVESAGIVGGIEAYQALGRMAFAEQDRLDGDPFEEWAAETGLDAEKFAAARASAEVHERLRADVEAAQSLNIRSVPVLFIDGRRFDHWRNREAWPLILGVEPAAPTAAASAPADAHSLPASASAAP